jgi:arylsulfatase A-like enzyme
VLARHVVRWLEAQQDRPFFALVFFTAPHSPYDPPRGYRRFFDGLPRGKVVSRPRREYRRGMREGDRAWTVAAYDGDLLYADAQVGKLIEALRASGQLERTHVIVTADHGEVFGEHGCFQHGYHMWDPVLRVPFVLSSPALPGGGLYDDRPFSHLDVLPTLLDLAGLDPDPALPGESIVEALADPRANRERALLGQYNAHGIRRQAIRQGRWKLVHHHAVDRADAARLNTFNPSRAAPDPADLPTVSWDTERYELFDMLADPGELSDRYAARRSAPETVALIGELTEQLAGDDDSSIELDEELLRTLRRLGYLAPKPE